MITIADLRNIAPQSDLAIIASLVPGLNTYLPLYDINTPSRIAMFLAQWAEETAGFTTLREYGNGAAYEGRKDLGNVYAGDGARFIGRGLAMLTGRANYAEYGRLLGLDLIGDPDLAGDPTDSVLIACAYWRDKGLNTWADRGDIAHVTYLINGGENGLAQRTAYYNRAKQVIAADDTHAAGPVPLPDPRPSAPIAAGPIPAVFRTPEGSMMGTAAIGAGGTIFASGGDPLRVALAVVIIGVALLGGYFLYKRLNLGK